MVTFKFKQKKFGGDLKKKHAIKDCILLKVLNTCVSKLIKTLVDVIMSIIFPLY